jgi:enoyl-CoA hydratase
VTNQLIFKVSGSVGQVTLNRPEKLNVLDTQLLKELDSIIFSLYERSDIRILVLRGAGERAFSAGADIEAFAKQDRESVRDLWVPLGHRILDGLTRIPQVTIAALNGSAFGGGLELALACDLRIAVSGKQFALPELGLGTTPGWGGTSRIVDVIGLSRAKYLLLSGNRISSEQALDWGLVHELHEGENFDAGLNHLIEKLLMSSPTALKLAKKLLNAGGSGIQSEILESLSASVTATTQDLREGIQAFKEKRKPKFEGG